MNPNNIAVIATALAITISEKVKDNDELALIAAILTQVGDTLVTISAAKTHFTDNSNNKKITYKITYIYYILFKK